MERKFSQVDDQLLMFLGGQAGSGKSHLIKAVKFFCDKWQLKWMLQCAATTGCAASLIEGATVHHALGIEVYKSKENRRYRPVEHNKVNPRQINGTL